ncbi:MAG: penicillin-insensitive murein endopeptidase [Pyrinomonadaceae bacterium]
MAILKLTGSVGAGGSTKGLPHNDPADFQKVKDRFVELGYAWVAGETNPKSTDFINLIKLFQCIIKGKSKRNAGDGRIDLKGETHRWLAAQNAPGWINMTGLTGIGWRMTPLHHTANCWTTTWMNDRIQYAGMAYITRSMFISNAPPMWIRDLSPMKGGNASGHKSHQTGLDVDMRLPLLPPKTNVWDKLNAHTYTKYFHFDAAMAQVESIKSTMDTKFIFFNDPRFKGLATKEPNHGNHYHIRIKPPARIEGTYM